MKLVMSLMPFVFYVLNGPDRTQKPKGLILAQNERWRRGLGMQVERERFRKRPSKVADG